MELDCRLPIQFSIEGKMSVLIKIHILLYTLGSQKLISPINWSCERNLVLEGLQLLNLILR